jgi:hypothetical protein
VVGVAFWASVALCVDLEHDTEWSAVVCWNWVVFRFIRSHVCTNIEILCFVFPKEILGSVEYSVFIFCVVLFSSRVVLVGDVVGVVSGFGWRCGWSCDCYY